MVEQRRSLERELTRALVGCDDLDLLARATSAAWGRDNLELWERRVELTPHSSPAYGATLSEVKRLRIEYGLVPQLRSGRLHRY